MKYFGYIFRNIQRNPVRTVLTVSSIAVCGSLTMILLSLTSTNAEVGASLRSYNRIIAMSSQGLTQPVPIATLADIVRIDEEGGTPAILRTPDGLPAISPFSWFGGKYGDESFPSLAQFAVDPDTIFGIYDELVIPDDELADFRSRRDGAVIGSKLAAEKNLKLGDPLPLAGTFYPVTLELTVVGIYDSPSEAKRDLRMVFFDWDYLDELLKKSDATSARGNAGTILIKCKDSIAATGLSERIDEATRNSSTPTKTQSEEAFVAMFAEMIGDLQSYINWVGLAVATSLVLICGVSMAMTMRERITEVAVLKAIGFGKGLILFLVLAEAVIVAGLGGLLGALGTKFLFDVWDVSPYTAGFLPFFYVPWITALTGLAGALIVGLAGGMVPALQAARAPVIDGLRKVI